MKLIHTEILIDASAERVWQVLTGFADFPDWNPLFRSAKGDLTPGSQLEIHIQPQDGKWMTFKPTVLTAEPGGELRWIGHFLFPGIFDGEHHFILESIREGGVRFVQGKRQTR